MHIKQSSEKLSSHQDFLQAVKHEGFINEALCEVLTFSVQNEALK